MVCLDRSHGFEPIDYHLIFGFAKSWADPPEVADFILALQCNAVSAFETCLCADHHLHASLAQIELIQNCRLLFWRRLYSLGEAGVINGLAGRARILCFIAGNYVDIGWEAAQDACGQIAVFPAREVGCVT